MRLSAPLRHVPRFVVRVDDGPSRAAGMGVREMKKLGEEVHVDVDEARAGATLHVMRYVLAASLLLAIVALSTVWITGAVSQLPRHGWAVTAEEHALGH